VLTLAYPTIIAGLHYALDFCTPILVWNQASSGCAQFSSSAQWDRLSLEQKLRMSLQVLYGQSAKNGVGQRSLDALLLAAAFHFPHRGLSPQDDSGVLTL
jgi:hypothetical protein